MKTTFSMKSLFRQGFALVFSSIAWVMIPDCQAAPVQDGLVRTDIDWSSFMAGKDMIWKKAPTVWDNAPFLGNGVVGMQIRQAPKEKDVLQVDIARMDAQEHLEMDDSQKDGKGDWSYRRYRMPVGYFTLKFPAEITGWDLRLGLHDAMLTGSVTTKDGKFNLKAYAHASQPLLIVELSPEDGGKVSAWNWTGYPSVSPRTHSWTKDTGAKEAPNAVPGPAGSEVKAYAPVKVWQQPLRPAGMLATAWRQVDGAKGVSTLFISIAHSYPSKAALKDASRIVKSAVSTKKDALEKSHLKWWHDFYPESFVSIPDGYWDSFYWAQIYKIGAGMRADGPVLDLQGPWTGLPVNSWPGVWWNLNVQLTYWPCYTGNRLEAAKSLSGTLRKYRQNLIENVEPQYRADSAGIPRASGHDARQATGKPNGGSGSRSEVGSLAWTCHNLFLQYRMGMDDEFLRNDVFPLLRRAVNYYLHFVEKGEDGKLHLPPTLSPEYGIAPDCNYDLALFRWGCQTLLWSADRLKINDPLAPRWKEILRDLVDYPVNENGYMIGRGVPFKSSHRHYSHLFMVYPLHITDTSIKENADLMDKSIRHWHSLKGGLQGYSFTGGASLYATLLRGDDALEMLNGLKRYLRPNTLYKETFPVIETPMSGAASIHDMILQSWNDVVNVMPAVPSEWKDIVFHNLRAEGAFLVSAAKKDGSIQWVRVKSLAGEPLRLRAGMGADVRLSGPAATAMKREANGDWVGTPPKNSELLLSLPGVVPLVKPVAATPPEKPFGLP